MPRQQSNKQQSRGAHNMATKLPPPEKKAKAPERDPETIDLEEAIAKAKPKAATEQTPPNSIVPIQLKIPEARRNEFKAYAAMRGRTMNALFLDMFEEYKDKHA